MKMDIRIQVARELPIELQEHIWKTYNNLYILPDLMYKVETLLFNQEYEILLVDCSVLLSNVVNKLSIYNSDYGLSFNIALDYAFDRLFDCGSPDFDKITLLNIIKDNINNPYLLRITLETTKMLDAYGYGDKCTQITVLMEKLRELYNIIMPQGDYYLDMDD
jgi:hypothetical protein